MASRKGSPNKRAISAMRIIREKYPDYDPLHAMIELGTTSDDEGVRVACHKEVAQYMYPKRKAVEVSGPDGAAMQVVADVQGYEEALELLRRHGVDIK